MTAVLAMSLPASPLRVFVSSADASRRAALAGLVVRSGHEVAASDRAADLVLSETVRSGSRCLVIAAERADPHVDGLLPADASPDQLGAALQAVAAGLSVCAPSVAGAGFRGIDESPAQALMTPRELEVLNAIGDGLTNKAIARQLGISLHTVKFHIEAIFRKLGVRTRTGAIAKASQLRRLETLEL